MPVEAPKIDKRTYAQLIEQMERLAGLYTALPGKKFWQRSNDAKNDAGAALIRIFARMMELAIDRLNQVPENNFLAFLDLIGARLSPPRAARVPLTFELSTGSSNDTKVPTRTRVSAPPPEGEEEEVVFETEQDLVVSASKPVVAFTRDETRDSWEDLASLLDGNNQTSVFGFEGIRPIHHKLYLAQNEVFTVPESRAIILMIEFSETVQPAKLPLSFSLWNGKDWLCLAAEIKVVSGSTLEVALKNPPLPASRAINDIDAAWICVAPAKPLPSIGRVPAVNHITASYRAEQNGLVPEFGFTNTVALDLSKDFFPFGEQPRFNDTFYLASQEAFSKAKAPLTINVTLTNPALEPGILPPASGDVAGSITPAKASKNLTLVWEFWNAPAGQWNFIGETGPGASRPSPYNLTDGTRGFTVSGAITFKNPPNSGSLEVNGQHNSWIRVRIVNGNYGKEAYTISKIVKIDGKLVFKDFEMTVPELQPASFRPPSIKSITIDYSHTSPPQDMDCIVSENNFDFVNHSQRSLVGREAFSLFTSAGSAGPAVYLGFERPLSNRPVTLYADVEESSRDSHFAGNGRMPVRLIWEYASSSMSGWAPLWIQDETRGLTEPGLISFIGPNDMVRRREFGRNIYWLRIRRDHTKTPFSPRLRCLLMNTVWAEQVQSFQDEILGSSSGEPHQTFRTNQTPVLPDPCIEVRESELPSTEEQEKIKSEEGGNAISVIRDDVGRPEEVWVRWHEVPNLFSSDSRDRHYVINHLTGELHFGDGIQGMIPPQDRNNIRASVYRTGGGIRGNVPAGAVAQLKSTVPYIDKVMNWCAASGGADREDTTSLKKRGPRTIRHRNRAVTYQDFKDLAYAASSDVARVFVIFPRHKGLGSHRTEAENGGRPGRVDLIVVPRTHGPRPEPSQGLRRCVRNYILARSEAGVAVGVTAANWIEVSVTAEIVPATIAAAGTLGDEVRSQLQRFLHPLDGGFDKSGWEFGRMPQKSDFYRLIESIEGVDHISYLNIYPESEDLMLPRHQLERSLVVSGDHVITVKGL